MTDMPSTVRHSKGFCTVQSWRSSSSCLRSSLQRWMLFSSHAGRFRSSINTLSFLLSLAPYTKPERKAKYLVIKMNKYCASLEKLCCCNSHCFQISFPLPLPFFFFFFFFVYKFVFIFLHSLSHFSIVLLLSLWISPLISSPPNLRQIISLFHTFSFDSSCHKPCLW